MKAIAILGSPRKDGNSTVLARRILDVLRQGGALVEEFELGQMEFKGCRSCRACKTVTDHCVAKDGLTEVLEAFKAADVVVMSSPVHFGDVSAQFKGFFDRTYSFLSPEYAGRLTGMKKGAFVLSQGDPSPYSQTDIFPRYQHWLGVYGFSQTHLLHARGFDQIAETRGNPDLMAQADAIGRELLG